MDVAVSADRHLVVTRGGCGDDTLKVRMLARQLAGRLWPLRIHLTRATAGVGFAFTKCPPQIAGGPRISRPGLFLRLQPRFQVFCLWTGEWAFRLSGIKVCAQVTRQQETQVKGFAGAVGACEPRIMSLIESSSPDLLQSGPPRPSCQTPGGHQRALRTSTRGRLIRKSKSHSR